MKTIGECIRDKRIESGLRQTDVAKELGLGQTTLSGYESGRFFPNALVLSDLADLFGCTIAELCGREYEAH